MRSVFTTKNIMSGILGILTVIVGVGPKAAVENVLDWFGLLKVVTLDTDTLLRIVLVIVGCLVLVTLNYPALKKLAISHGHHVDGGIANISESVVTTATPTETVTPAPPKLGDVRISLASVNLSGLWRTDPYIEITLTIENDASWQGLINEIHGKVYCSGEICNQPLQFKGLSHIVMLKSKELESVILIQPFTEGMARDRRGTLSHKDGLITLDLWQVALVGRGHNGGKVGSLFRGVSEERIFIYGPIINEKMARTLFRFPAILGSSEAYDADGRKKLWE